jgi:hypothetical protein
MAGHKKPEETVDFRPQLQVTCTCGCLFFVGHNSKGVPMVLHDLPACRLFVDNDLPEFLRLVRQHLTAKAQA